MDRRGWTSGRPQRLLATAVSVVMVLAAAPAAATGTRPQPVTGWIRHHAAPLETVDPAAPLDDLAPLRRSIGDAEIVGLGESTHGAAEEISTADMFEYAQWYLAVADKGPYLRHAHQVLELVKGLPHRPGDRAHALAVHHARQIVSFYEHYSLPQRFTSQAMPQCQSGRSCWCWALLRWL